MITKISIINGSYSLMRISGFTRKPGPDELSIGLQVADDYAAELKAGGLDLQWAQPVDYGDSDPNDRSGLTRETAGAFKKLLTRQLFSHYGKDVPMNVERIAAEGMRAIEHLLVSVPNAELPPTLPFGSGNEDDYRDRKFYNEPATNNNADYVFKDDVLNETEDFTQWLAGETLLTVEWTSADTGIVIGSEDFDDSIAMAELTFNQSGGYSVEVSATKTGSTDRLTIAKNYVIKDPTPVGITFGR